MTDFAAEADPSEVIFDEMPAIPDQLLDKITKLHAQTVRIVLESKPMRGGRFKSIHAFEVERDAGGAPAVDPLQVAMHVVRIAEAHSSEIGDKQKYRAKLFNAEGKKPSVSFSYGGDESDPNDPTELDEQELGIMAIVLDRMQAMLSTQIGANERLIEKVIGMADKSSSTFDMLHAIIETMGQHYHLGINMQANALQILFNQQRADKEAEVKGERDKQLLNVMGVALPKFFEQFGKWAGMKVNQSMNNMGDDEEEEDEDYGPTAGGMPFVVDTTATGPAPGNPTGVQMEDEGQQIPQQQPEPADPLAGVDQKVKDKMEENPLTAFAWTLRDAITGDQWLEISKKSTKKMMAAIDGAFRADDDEGTIRGVLKLEQMLKSNVTTALSLMSIFDEEQKTALTKLLETAKTVAEQADD